MFGPQSVETTLTDRGHRNLTEIFTQNISPTTTMPRREKILKINKSLSLQITLID